MNFFLLLKPGVVVGFIFLFVGCAPTFSELQSAKLVGKDQLEVTPYYSSTVYHETSDSEKAQNHFGVQAAIGLLENLDFRLRYEQIKTSDGSFDVHVFGAGPKFAFIKDYLAGYFPVGFGFGDDVVPSETWQIHPTLLATFPFGDFLEFNPSTKVMIPFRDNQEIRFALNFGVGLSTNLNKWSIRPEYGFLFQPGASGNFQHFSIGLTLYSR
jgi:hypothetical protein